MVVFALILLFFANHQSPAILFDTSFTGNLGGGGGAARRAIVAPSLVRPGTGE